MDKYSPGCSGQGHTGTTKYGAESAPVVKNGGNTEIQDGVTKEATPSSLYKSGGSYKE